MPERTRVLVLDGETTQALATVRSLGRAGHELLVASKVRRPLAAWSRFCLASLRVEAHDLAAFAALRAQARSHGVRVVLPQTERSCVLLNLEAEAWQAAGIVLGCGSAEMLRTAFDKAETLRRAVERGIPVPPTRFPTSDEEVVAISRELRPPWVVKSRFSHSWQGNRFLPDLGVAYVSREKDLVPVVRSRRQGNAWPVVQEFVRGAGKGVFALADRGEVVQWFAHQRLRDVRPSGSGSSLRRSVALDPHLREASSRLLQELQWHGPAMLEFRDDGTHAPWLIEMNGRFWGSLQLAISSGADFPAQWMRLLLGERPAPLRPYREGIVMRWIWGDVRRLGHLLRGAPPGFPDPYPRVRHGLVELLGPQPRGTRHETWDGRDPWPAVAELFQGVALDLVPSLLRRREVSPHPSAAH